jgi:U4/U6.U5 tri-snRNP-associated protein 1
MSHKFKVGHNQNEFSEGMDYEFVLKDKKVTDDNDFDELENAILKDLSGGNKPKVYSLLNKAWNEEKKEILPEYSEKKDIGFIVSDLKDEKSEINVVKEKFRQLKESKNKFDLNYTKAISNDYMTHEEFNKKFKPLKKVNKIKSIEKEEIDLIKPSHHKKILLSEEDELEKALEQQRNLILKAKRTQEETLKEIIERNKNKEIENEDVAEISEAVEFLKNIPTKNEIEEDIKLSQSKTILPISASKNGAASVVNIPLPTERLKYGVSSIIKEEKHNDFLGKKRERENDISENDTTINNEINNIEVAELEDPPLGKGIAMALKVFKQRGMIGKDNSINDAVQKRQKDINLEYRDEKGRLMSQKEAYRYMCHIFHQNKPSLRQREKQLKKEQIEERNKNMDVSMNTKSLKYLKSQQLRNNTPFVVLQGKNSINNL